MGIGVEQAVDIAEEHQKIRPAESGHDGGQGVVVPQDLVVPRLDLGGGDGVVFIDDGNDPHFQQGVEGVGQVLRPDGIVHVVPRQQDLPHRAGVFGKELIVDVHDVALSHGCRCLLVAELRGPRPHLQLGHPHGNGAGGYQDHLVSHAVQIGQHPGHPLDALKVQNTGRMGQRRCAHLDDDPLFSAHSRTLLPAPGNALRSFCC